MNTAIIQTLHTTCQTHDIMPLYACESGSRAWGFMSCDSDFDVRLIYKHSPDWYLQIYDDKDTFEFINHDLLDVPFDIGGWDIKKALAHIHKSNVVIFEWLNSPVTYHSDDNFIKMIKPILPDFFNPKSAYHHYQGMANKANSDIKLDKPIKLKKWFYLIRALLASLWIKEYQTMPPVYMTDMFNLLKNHEKYELNHIITLKSKYDENYSYQLSDDMINLTQNLWQNTQNINFDDKPKGDIGILNDVFRKVVFDI